MVNKMAYETDYDLALKRAEKLLDAEMNTPEGDEIDRLIDMIEEYEAIHYPITIPKDEL
jgi:HTH-type transcriptional regulator/antitoxin HigA